MRAVSVLACGAALTLSAPPSVADVFAVTTRGDHAIKGRVELSGVAVAVAPGLLLTAARAIGSARDFKAGPGGGPSRTVTIRDLDDDARAPAEVTVGGRPADGQVAVLVADAAAAPMVPEPLSACPLVEGGTYDLRGPAAGDGVIGQLAIRAAGQVIRFTAGPDRDAGPALGAPVVDPDGRVAAIVTDVAPAGGAVGVTPVADIVRLLPADAEIACDPRVDRDVVRALERKLEGLTERVRDAEGRARELSDRLEAAEQTGNFAVDVLADVATDLEKINAARASGGDISGLLDSMKTRLQSLKLAPTVKTIDALLRRPDWTAGAKSQGGTLRLTFTYRTQLPGPGFSNSLRLCLRAIKPYKSSEGAHDFRTPDFYARATADDPDRLVECATTNVNIPAGRQDMGQYVFEVSRDDMAQLFAAYREARDWVPADYAWSGLTYAVLVKPGAVPGATEAIPDEVILHLLVIPPDEGRPGAAAVQCKLFENQQAVIDFLALDDWASDETAFDDVAGVVLDPENASDECVPPSVQ